MADSWCAGPGGETESASFSDRTRRDHAFHHEPAAIEEAKEKLSVTSPAASPNPADPNAISLGVRAAVKSAVQAGLETASRCSRTGAGPPARRREQRQEGRVEARTARHERCCTKSPGSTFTHLSRGASRRSTPLWPRSAPRPRDRRNRALVKTAHCSLECIALKHLQRGGLPAGRQVIGPRLPRS